MKKIVSVLVLVTLVGVAYTAYSIYTKNSSKYSENLRPDPSNIVNDSTIVSANAASVQMQKSEVHSIDGDENLILEQKPTANGIVSYTLYTCDKECFEKTQILSENLPGNVKIELPFNAWSPNNNYIFITKKGSGVKPTYLVYKANGEEFSEGKQFINASAIFAEKQPELILKDITGWDANALLHVVTTNTQGGKGPYFWLEIPSESLIQLSSR